MSDDEQMDECVNEMSPPRLLNFCYPWILADAGDGEVLGSSLPPVAECDTEYDFADLFAIIKCNREASQTAGLILYKIKCLSNFTEDFTQRLCYLDVDSTTWNYLVGSSSEASLGGLGACPHEKRVIGNHRQSRQKEKPVEAKIIGSRYRQTERWKSR